MKTIHKFPVSAGINYIALPKNSVLLHVGSQGGQLYAWIQLDTYEQYDYTFRILVMGTGWHLEDYDLDETYVYCNTVIEEFGYVWHVFYRMEE